MISLKKKSMKTFKKYLKFFDKTFMEVSKSEQSKIPLFGLNLKSPDRIIWISDLHKCILNFMGPDPEDPDAGKTQKDDGSFYCIKQGFRI